MSSPTPNRSGLQAWLTLVRIPAVFTVIAQIAAAFILASGSAQPVARLVAVVFAGISLYWSGMILNDLWDIEEDTQERPSRPLPSGEISVRSAKEVAWGLMGLGVLLAALSGFIPGGDVDNTLCPAMIGFAVAGCVLLYNGPLKKTLLAPATMGICRSLCFLLGAAPLVVVNTGNLVDVVDWFPGHIVGAAVGMGIYIMGITAISRSETLGGHVAEIAGGVAIICLGAVCLALAPKFAPAGTTWVVALNDRFPLLIGLIVFSVVFRGIRVAIRPEPVAIQNLIRVGVMTLIPLAAAFAILTAGPTAGLAIFALIVPAIVSAARFRVT